MRRSLLAFGAMLALASPAFAEPVRGTVLQRTFGAQQPAVVTNAIRTAKQAKNIAAHDEHLVQVAKKNAASLPIFAMTKLARSTMNVGSREKILQIAARAHAGSMTFTAARDLIKKGAAGSGAYYKILNHISAQVLAENPDRMTLEQQQKLKNWSTQGETD